MEGGVSGGEATGMELAGSAYICALGEMGLKLFANLRGEGIKLYRVHSAFAGNVSSKALKRSIASWRAGLRS